MADQVPGRPLGGDCFALYSPANGPVIALNGSGYAPGAATLDHYLERGIDRIDENSPDAVTIPGAVSAWERLVEGYGRLDLAQVLEPAIRAAEAGYRIHPRVQLDWERYSHRIAGNAAAVAHFLPDGRAPAVGDRMAAPALARTLKRVAKNGPEAFYRGEVAEELISALRGLGGLHQLDDFADFAAFETDPISGAYRGHDVLECPPNGQGLAALLIARILDGFDLSDARLTEADRIHLFAEASKAAYGQRTARLTALRVSNITTRMRFCVASAMARWKPLSTQADWCNTSPARTVGGRQGRLRPGEEGFSEMAVTKYAFEAAPVPAVPVAGTDQFFPVRRIYCVGRNYAAHAIEMGHDPSREPPFFFQKNADNVTLVDGNFPYPHQSKDVHFEIEMVVGLGKGGKNIAIEDALDHVFGYGVGLDMTLRDIQAEAKELRRPWEVAKAFEHSAPCGPIHPVSAVGHPSQGAIWVDVNGGRRQTGDLNQMIWKVPEIISYLSGLFRLAPGDLIFTGTPAGVGKISTGDVLHCHVDGVGDLSVAVA